MVDIYIVGFCTVQCLHRDVLYSYVVQGGGGPGDLLIVILGVPWSVSYYGGTIVNRTYGIHVKTIYLTIFTINIWPY